MKTYVRKGKNKNIIIDSFKEEMGIKNDSEFSYEIESDGKKILGFTINPIIIKFNYQSIDDALIDYIKNFMSLINIEFETIDVKKDEKYIHVHLKKVENSGFVIGKDARFLDSFQLLTNRFLDRYESNNKQVIIDVDGYRERKEDNIRKKVSYSVERALKMNKVFTMEPMNAKNRRVVHKFLENDSRVRTLTTGGKSELKRIAIIPQKIYNHKKDKKNNKTKE